MVRIKQILAALVLCLLTAVSASPAVLAGAQQSKSTNYGVSEVNFGSGGDVHVCSTSYCSKQSAGELTVGNTKSGNYQAQAGFNTDRQPLLEVSVGSGAINLGTLSAGGVAYGSTTFTVRNYLAYGYSVTISGEVPYNKSANHYFATMSSADISRPGTEQFGINVVANTSPAVGSNPVQIPDSSFSFGAAAAGYDTPNKFKYVDGDSIAGSASSSGETDYTLSAIENIPTNMPAGLYVGQLDVLVSSTF